MYACHNGHTGVCVCLCVRVYLHVCLRVCLVMSHRQPRCWQYAQGTKDSQKALFIACAARLALCGMIRIIVSTCSFLDRALWR